jgi:hypothetical protein
MGRASPGRFHLVASRDVISGHFPSRRCAGEIAEAPCFPEEPRVIGRLFESGVSVPLAPAEATEKNILTQT